MKKSLSFEITNEMTKLLYDVEEKLFNDFLEDKDRLENETKFESIINIIKFLCLPDNVEVYTKYKDIIMNKYKRHAHFCILKYFKPISMINSKIEDLQSNTVNIKMLDSDYIKINMLRHLFAINDLDIIDISFESYTEEELEKPFICESWDYVKFLFNTTIDKPATIKEFKNKTKRLINNIICKNFILSKSKKENNKAIKFCVYNQELINYNKELESYRLKFLDQKIDHDLDKDIFLDD
jgi:hypothetical protein